MIGVPLELRIVHSVWAEVVEPTIVAGILLAVTMVAKRNIENGKSHHLRRPSASCWTLLLEYRGHRVRRGSNVFDSRKNISILFSTPGWMNWVQFELVKAKSGVVGLNTRKLAL